MSKDIRVIRKDCCNIWNNLKDKTQMIDCLIESKQQIADLEAKLAEKQSKIQELNDMYEDLLVAKGTENELMQVSADCNFFAKENRKLKQQLAEKEKENMALAHIIAGWNNHNQDKISLCIEQLENCRLNLIKLLNKKLVYLDSSTADEMDDLFNNQIKQLKEIN